MGMQTIDKANNIVAAETGELGKLLKKREKLLKDPNVKEVVIDELPKMGDRFKIGRLVFCVTQVRPRGRISAKLLGSREI